MARRIERARVDNSLGVFVTFGIGEAYTHPVELRLSSGARRYSIEKRGLFGRGHKKYILYDEVPGK